MSDSSSHRPYELGRGIARRPRLWILLVLATGCAKPAQSGGLGVFHPQDFAGRMALVDRFNGPKAVAAKKKPSNAPTVVAESSATPDPASTAQPAVPLKASNVHP